MSQPHSTLNDFVILSDFVIFYPEHSTLQSTFHVRQGACTGDKTGKCMLTLISVF